MFVIRWIYLRIYCIPTFLINRNDRGLDDVDRLDMLIQRFVVVDNDDEDEERAEEVPNKNIA